MSNPIVMPQLGLTMTEGKLSCWLKKPGEVVKKNEPLLTVETDKAEMEVESLVEGTLGEILVEAGNLVPVGTVLAYVIGDPAQAEPSKDAPHVESAATEPAIEPPIAARQNLPARGKAAGPKLSPRAKRLARELNVDAGPLIGTGINGEIVEEDIRKAAATQSAAAPTATPGPSVRRRLIIAERLVQSIRTIPTFSVTTEANAEQLLALHEELKQLAAADGQRLTITDMLLTAFARTVDAHQEINSIWQEDGPLAQGSVDIGLAVATSEGVIAPVLKGLASLSIADLVTRRQALTERARTGKLSLTDLEGGTTTLSNLGMFRVDNFDALIAPGQSSILAVGAIRNRPWVEGEALAVAATVNLTFTVDHRVADGATAAAFLGDLVDAIEKPRGFAWTPSSKGDGNA